ncbi:hypothetical protein [Methylorubrum suomiense]|uniref:hypothetical protein n=1 Tax=Methylorubrum suomiense TaxID=144191 RepID=UPI001EE20D71|nr:hypothetical protein [Methylorubrum suomiense]
MRYLVAAILYPFIALPAAAEAPSGSCQGISEVAARTAASIDGMAASMRRRSSKEMIAMSRGERRAALQGFEDARLRLLPELDAYSAAASRLAEAFRYCDKPF